MPLGLALFVIGPLIAAWFAIIHAKAAVEPIGGLFWLGVIAAWLIAWFGVDLLANRNFKSSGVAQAISLLIPFLFGIWLLIIWQLITTGFKVPTVLLPPPSDIGVRFSTSLPTLWADFQQTFLKAVLFGYIMGCSSAFIIAILIDKSSFLQRGLLPIGNFVSALPIVGVAPIMVMWFGFDWHSKAGVVIIMTFFPMLVNTIAGLADNTPIQRDLMKTYAARLLVNVV